MNQLSLPSWDSPEGRVWISRIRDNVPFIAITLVILLFWFISGDRFMSVETGRSSQQTPVLLLLAFAQLLVVTTGSIDISVGSNLGLAPIWLPLGECSLVRRVGFSGWNIFGRFHWCTEWDDLLAFQISLL